MKNIQKVWGCTHCLFAVNSFIMLLILSFPAHVFAKQSVLSKAEVQFIQGKFNPRKHKNFTRVHKKYATKSGLYMNKEAYNAFVKMSDQAKKDGIRLKIISATRTFAHQKRIWQAKWSGKRKVKVNGYYKKLNKAVPNPKLRALYILKYSSMPGTSRHHWGTDIDINSLSSNYFLRKKGRAEYNWLKKNAKKFGFCQTYSRKNNKRPYGYNEEKWHWSYVKTARQYTNKIRTAFSHRLIKGFLGSKTAKDIHVVERFMLGVNKDCL